MKEKLPYFIFGTLGIIIFPFYLYRINPDAISYYEIAKNYALGNFVVNGFWSPLLSWLLIPFYLLHIPFIFGFGLIQLLFGFGALFATQKILTKVVDNVFARSFTIYAAIPLILYFVYEPVVTPDLLSMTFLLFYFNSILSQKNYGIKAGIFGALAYFAKTYAFFFFIVHFALVAISKRNEKELLKGFITFLFLTIPWILILSITYHHPTYGNAGSYNFQVNRPGGVDYAQYYNGLVVPQKGATSVWYDPSVLHIIYNKPANVLAEATGWVKIISKNIFLTILNYEAFSVFAIFILAYYLYTYKEKNHRILLGTFVLFSSGYLIYHIEDRFIWFNMILLLIMAAGMIKHKRVLTLLLLFSFIFIPTKRIISNINYRKELTSFSKTVKVTGNVASNEEWNESLYIAYFNNAKYYGITKGSEKDILQNIHDKHITYYLIWKEGSSYSFLSTFNKVQETPDLTVYKVN